MRILHVVSLVDDDATCGGRLAVALNQCAELRRRGHDARLLAGWAGACEPPTELEGIPAHLFRTSTLGGRGAARFSLAMTAWLRRNAGAYDLVHLHFARDAVQVSAAAVLDRAGVPYVVQTHGSLRPTANRIARWTDRLFTVPAVRSAQHCLVADPAERRTVAEITDSPLGLTQIGPGIVLPYPRPGVPSRGTLDVVYAGRVSAARGTLDFAEVAKASLEAGLDARFEVIGPDGGELTALTDFVRDHPELRGRLRYEGALSHERAVERIRRADLFLMPAQDGVSSMAVLEALSAGVATVVTTGYSHAITLRARRAAKVVKPTVAAMTQAVRELAADPLTRAELGRRGRVAASRAFDICSVVDEIEAVYAEAIQQTKLQAWVAEGAFPVDDSPLDVEAGQVEPGAAEWFCEEPSDQLGLDGAQSLLWVTTEVTPYRLALWREVARLSTLTVALLAASQANWRLQLDAASEPFTIVQLNAPAVPQANGVQLYAPNRGLRTLVRRRPEAIVLDGWESPAFHKTARWARRAGIPVVATYRGTRAGDPQAGPHSERALKSLRRRVDAVFTGNPEPAFFAPPRPSLPPAMESLAAEQVQRPTVPRQATAGAGGAAGAMGAAGAGGAGAETTTAGRVVDIRNGHQFLFVGELIGRKNVEGLLRAFHLARGLGDTLTIVGNGPLGPNLVELAASLGIDDSVIFVNALGDLRRRRPMALGQTLVLPSTDEIWSGIVEEAVSEGLHVVVSTACGISEHVRLHPHVLTAEPTPEALARAMTRSRQRWTDRRRPGLVSVRPAAPTAPVAPAETGAPGAEAAKAAAPAREALPAGGAART